MWQQEADYLQFEETILSLQNVLFPDAQTIGMPGSPSLSDSRTSPQALSAREGRFAI